MTIWSRLFQTSKMDAELDEELRVHLSMAQRDRVDRGGDSVAVLRAPAEGLQDQHVQGPLQQLDTVLVAFRHSL